MKRIIVLGGGSDQIALINEIRKQEIDAYIILVDYLSYPIAKEYADIHIQKSTLDKEVVLSIAKEQNADYVLTACTDQALLTMAYVSEKLELPCYLTYQQALELTNKLYMKQIMVENNIPTAKHICIDENYKSEQFKTLQFPLVVKPVDSNSSKGVKKILLKSDLDGAIKEAFSYSICKNVIVEEFKEGEELSVDVYIEGKTAKLLSITASQKVKNTDSFTIIQSYYPVPVQIEENKIINIAQQIANTFHLENTPLLIQMIAKNDEYNVVEFSARMGGGSKYHLINVLSGVDIMKTYVSMCLGQDPKVFPKKQVEYAIMNYVYCYPGEYVRLKNFDEAIQCNVITDYFVYKTSPAHFEKANNSSDRIAGFLITGNTKEEVFQKLSDANHSLQVLDNSGHDIMRHDFFE